MRIARRPLRECIAAMVGGMLLLCTTVQAEVQTDGSWAGTNITPVNTADPALLVREPAIVLLFRPEPEQFAAIRQFEQFAGIKKDAGFAVYGLAVPKGGQTDEILMEIVIQKNLSVPVFVGRTSVLGRENLKMVVIKDGRITPIATGDFVAAELATAVGTAAADGTTSAPVKPKVKKPSRYVNRTSDFVVRFPKAWDYKISRNGDGAVGEPPAGTTLDLRIWTTRNAPDGTSGENVTIREYLDIYLKTLGTQASTTVDVDKSFSVEDGDSVGREYIYSYATADGTKMRGRVQGFKHEGTFKVVRAEGPADQFQSNSRTIETFIGSFRVTADREEMVYEQP